jgi:hypothetical protein
MNIEDEIFAELDRWLRSNPRARKRTLAIRRAARRLHGAADSTLWNLVLDLEECMNARHEEMVRAAIRLTMRRLGKRAHDASRK